DPFEFGFGFGLWFFSAASRAPLAFSWAFPLLGGPLGGATRLGGVELPGRSAGGGAVTCPCPGGGALPGGVVTSAGRLGAVRPGGVDLCEEPPACCCPLALSRNS